VTSASKGAALLVHEAIAPEIADIMSEAAKASGQEGVAQVFKDIQNYHTTPSEVAKIGREAKVGGVALTHIVPALQIKALEVPFMGKAAAEFAAGTKRPFWLMHDGDLISIAQNGELEKRNILRY
jgi:ribonuclease Z